MCTFEFPWFGLPSSLAQVHLQTHAGDLRLPSDVGVGKNHREDGLWC